MIATEVESQAPISMVVPLQTAEEVAHEQDVNAFLVSSGIGEGCKKRKRKLLAMNSHSFQVLKLNSVIGTFCKVL